MHKISEWERAIRRREDIIYNEIYLKDGLVETVIGAVLIPCRVVRRDSRSLAQGALEQVWHLPQCKWHLE